MKDMYMTGSCQANTCVLLTELNMHSPGKDGDSGCLTLPCSIHCCYSNGVLSVAMETL